MFVTATYDLPRSVDHEPYVTENSIMLVCLPFINYFSNFILLKFSHISTYDDDCNYSESKHVRHLKVTCIIS